jgi:hypothetical protein
MHRFLLVSSGLMFLISCAQHAPMHVPIGAKVRVDAAVRTRPSGRELDMTVENTGDATIAIEESLHVEILDLHGWVDTETIRPWMSKVANIDSPRCVDLAPGARLTTEPWDGMSCFRHAACNANVPMPAGTYRVVAHACVGEVVAVGSPVAWGAPPISDEDAIHAARREIEGKITLSLPARPLVERRDGVLIVTFPRGRHDGERSGDFDARVRVDAATGRVVGIEGAD